MSVAVFLKDNLRNIPPSIGKVINQIPYSNRPGLGKIYTARAKEISQFEAFSTCEQKKFIFDKVKIVVEHAVKHVPFYTKYYADRGFDSSTLLSFDDIVRIPPVSKHILNEYQVDYRSFFKKGRYLVNTGGSSGTPFSFYIEPSSMGHEWAHMHHIWRKLGYNPSDFKLVFGGRSNVKEKVEYDVVRNHFAIDIYADYRMVAKKLKGILKKYPIKYLHGYPSSMYDFAIFCEKEDPELLELMSKQLRGAFLGSEYPHKLYRSKIEELFGVESISWYGHTERAVLAYEKREKYKYEPFQTYGYAEALKLDNNSYHLLATSYYNFTSPLIRYNTLDTISDVRENGGMLESFTVKDGREGEFVIDKIGKKINLTGLIFGRHHEIFNYSKFIQVKQVAMGKIEIYFVSNLIDTIRANELFDSDNLNLDISFVKVDSPIRTQSGKINLLIK